MARNSHVRLAAANSSHTSMNLPQASCPWPLGYCRAARRRIRSMIVFYLHYTTPDRCCPFNSAEIGNGPHDLSPLVWAQGRGILGFTALPPFSPGDILLWCGHALKHPACPFTQSRDCSVKCVLRCPVMPSIPKLGVSIRGSPQ